MKWKTLPSCTACPRRLCNPATTRHRLRTAVVLAARLQGARPRLLPGRCFPAQACPGAQRVRCCSRRKWLREEFSGGGWDGKQGASSLGSQMVAPCEGLVWWRCCAPVFGGATCRFGRVDHVGWCNHKCGLCAWNLFRRDFVGDKPSFVLETSVCSRCPDEGPCPPTRVTCREGGREEGRREGVHGSA